MSCPPCTPVSAHACARVQAAALRSHASECAAEAERAQRSALQSDAVHAASSAEEVAQLREQVSGVDASDSFGLLCGAAC